MTITLFMSMLAIGSAISGLLTEALKKAVDISSNLTALISALVVGIFGTLCAYVLMGVEVSLKNVICIFLMALCIWVGSMVGYDKVIQTISQIRRQ